MSSSHKSTKRPAGIHPDAHTIDLRKLEAGWSVFRRKGKRARLREDATGFISEWYYVVEPEEEIAPPLDGAAQGRSGLIAYGESADIGTDDGVHNEGPEVGQTNGFNLDDFVDATNGQPASEMEWKLVEPIVLKRCGNTDCKFLGERVGDHECEPYQNPDTIENYPATDDDWNSLSRDQRRMVTTARHVLFNYPDVTKAEMIEILDDFEVAHKSRDTKSTLRDLIANISLK